MSEENRRCFGLTEGETLRRPSMRLEQIRMDDGEVISITLIGNQKKYRHYARNLEAIAPIMVRLIAEDNYTMFILDALFEAADVPMRTANMRYVGGIGINGSIEEGIEAPERIQQAYEHLQLGGTINIPISGQRTTQEVNIPLDKLTTFTEFRSELEAHGFVADDAELLPLYQRAKIKWLELQRNKFKCKKYKPQIKKYPTQRDLYRNCRTKR